MKSEKYARVFGHGYLQQNDYGPDAEAEERKKVAKRVRFVSLDNNGPLECCCKLDNNGEKCNKRSELDQNGNMLDMDACPNLSFNFECRPDKCGVGCKNQDLQTFNATIQVAPVEVQNTGRYGLGLFSTKDLHPGTIIGEYVGVVKCQARGERNVGSFYAFGLGDGFDTKFDLIVDAEKEGNYVRICNHSCDPNCSTQQIIVANKFHIIVKVIRLIPEGTEVTISYGKEFFKFAGIDCACGSFNCISLEDPGNQVDDE